MDNVVQDVNDKADTAQAVAAEVQGNATTAITTVNNAMTTVGNIVAGTQVLDKALIDRGAAFAGNEVMNVNGDVVLQGDLSAVGKTITCQKLVCNDYPGGGGSGKYTEAKLENIFSAKEEIAALKVTGVVTVDNERKK